MATLHQLQEKLRQAEWLLQGAHTDAQRLALAEITERWRALIQKKFDTDAARSRQGYAIIPSAPSGT
jgi:hypothetical protein